jgi:hypothetical protein
MRIYATLDTNVYVRHAFSIELLNSIDELSKLFNDLRLVFPEVVEQECDMLYQAKVAAGLKKGMRPAELREEFSRVESELRTVADEHFARWHERIRKSALSIPTTNEHLRSAYVRMMRKAAPCHLRDAMRDAIIWETVLALETSANKNVLKIFVTQDDDFPFESDSCLQGETRSAGVLWFRTFSEFQQWAYVLRPTPLLPELDLDEWYEVQDFAWATAGRLEEELDEYLIEHTGHFDFDAEVVDLYRTSWRLKADSEDSEARDVSVYEEWDFSVSYAVGAEVRVGGSDGVDFDVSGWRRASGNALILRTLRFDAHRNVISNDVDIKRIELEDDEGEWDPYEAWLDSLDDDRDDA